MNRPVVGIDLDDVLADFIKTFMSMAGQEFGIDPDSRPTSWEWDGVDMKGFTKKHVLDTIWAQIAQTPNFWQKLDVIPGVDRLLIGNLALEAKVYFPTAREQTVGKDAGDQSAAWLWDNFLIEYPQVFVSRDKGTLAKALKYDYFIDDRPVNCLAIQEAVPSCKVYMQDANHNKSVDLLSSNGIPRLLSVNDFADIVLARG